MTKTQQKKKEIKEIMDDIKKIVRFQEVDGITPIDPEYMAIMVEVRLEGIMGVINSFKDFILNEVEERVIQDLAGAVQWTPQTVKKYLKEYRQALKELKK